MKIVTNDFLTNAVLTNGKTRFRKLREMLRLVLNFGTKPKISLYVCLNACMEM
jgi:hypothetical protein